MLIIRNEEIFTKIYVFFCKIYEIGKLKCTAVVKMLSMIRLKFMDHHL